jgi:hypothetical protein
MKEKPNTIKLAGNQVGYFASKICTNSSV